MVSRVGRVRGVAVARTALGLSGCVTDPPVLKGPAMTSEAIPVDTAQMAEDARCYRHLSSARPTGRRPAMAAIEIMTAIRPTAGAIRAGRADERHAFSLPSTQREPGMENVKHTMLTAMLALAAAMAFGAVSTPASAQEQYSLTFGDHSVGRTAETARAVQGLWVKLEIRRTGLRISGAERSEICAEFYNHTASSWWGDYRVTDRDVNDTHAWLEVPAYETRTRCETLSPQMVYYVVLRRD